MLIYSFKELSLCPLLICAGGIVTLEPAAVSRLLGLGVGGQCGDSHGLLTDLLAVEVDSRAVEQVDETELERLTEDRAVPSVSPHKYPSFKT
jgi:hypothetical protein